jgi:hypothetical protein
LALVIAALACAPSPASEQDEREAVPPVAGTPEQNAALGKGLVVWESNRSGAYRIWIRELAAGEPRQLSPDEPGRDHCCAHLSPAGDRLVYLTLPGGLPRYTEPTVAGELRLVDLVRNTERVLVERARHYGEHRAALWWSDHKLVYIDERGASRLLDLVRAGDRVLAQGPTDGQGFLIDPTGRYATGSMSTFSQRHPETGKIQLATYVGGCQAWLSADGEVGVWAAGAGGPIDAIDLETRATWTILAKDDPLLPDDRGYVYFPMLSQDRSLLAFAASSGEHDHFKADYDIFVVELDAETLMPAERPVRITSDPAVDRFPDVWRPARASVKRTPLRAPRASTPAPGTDDQSWPSSREALALVWEGADRLNRRSDEASSEVLTGYGETWTDRHGRLALAGGLFAAEAASAARVVAAAHGTNALTVEVLLEPAALGAGASGPILAAGTSPRRRAFALRQDGDRLSLVLRTGATGPGGGEPLPLLRLPDASPHHVAFSYSPGRLRVYLDGEQLEQRVVIGDFFGWRFGDNAAFLVGAEPGVEDSRFRGHLSHLAIFSRELSPAEVKADAQRALAGASRGPVQRLEVTARLVERARIPTLDEISPYRVALVAEVWKVESVRSGEVDQGELRVARWALLDGKPTAAMTLRPGASARLELEPYAAQAQLQNVVLSEAGLANAGSGTLWHDVAVLD